jgi:hypothetical protein
VSTICKIDPSVRKARATRREMRLSLGRTMTRLTGFELVRASATHAYLTFVTREPSLTGAQKNALFMRAINTLTAGVN